MAKNQTNQTVSDENLGYERKKITADYIDLAELAEKKELFIGTYLGLQSGPWIDKKTGEEKTLTRVIFDRRDPRHNMVSLGRQIVFQDAGLKKALEDGMVKEHDTVEVQWLGKTDIGQGRTVNQYDIFAVEHAALRRPVMAAPLAAKVAS